MKMTFSAIVQRNGQELIVKSYVIPVTMSPA